jgi:TPR repeat protein
MKTIFVKALLLVLLGGVSYGDDFEDAYAAYQKKDYKTAFKLYNSACENGVSSGCNIVGAFFEDGLGIQKNNQSAITYYNKACEMGDETGCKDSTRLQNALPVCTQDQLSFLNDKRYFNVASSDTNPVIVADTQTIRIDKKNKTIQVWVTFIFNQKGRDGWIQDYGKNYNSFGYFKDFEVINYANMTNKSNTSTHYNCDGGSIKTFGDGKWYNTIPGSVMEVITQSIMKKYNLK